MADRYDSFAKLAAATRAGVDYRIRCVDRGTSVVVLAPHGGTIEPETAQIAEAIAGELFSFYAFEALKPGVHGDFHITSHRFDEPQAIDLVRRSHRAVAVHGRKDDGHDTVWLGGLATGMRDAIGQALRDAGFAADLNTALPGVHKTNICNRTSSGAGVQLELPRSLRRTLADNADIMNRFCCAVRDGICGAGSLA
tara:strand:+ start:32637 stop:33224 length:588 start_codon:yes stop_codon:yes gene_type:complete